MTHVRAEGFTLEKQNPRRFPSAQMAELVDALVSGISGRKAVGVRVPFWAPCDYRNAAVAEKSGIRMFG